GVVRGVGPAGVEVAGGPVEPGVTPLREVDVVRQVAGGRGRPGQPADDDRPEGEGAHPGGEDPRHDVALLRHRNDLPCRWYSASVSPLAPRGPGDQLQPVRIDTSPSCVCPVHRLLMRCRYGFLDYSRRHSGIAAAMN